MKSRFKLHHVYLSILLLSGTAPWAGGTILPAPTVTNSAPPFDVPFVASNAVDSTEADYASASQGVDTFLEFSFGSPQTFDKIVVLNRDSPGQSDLIANFTVTFDGGSGIPVIRNPMRGSSEIHVLGLRTATNIRLDVDTIGTGDNFNNTGAMEVFFVRTPAGQSPITGLSIFNASPAFAPFFSADNAIDGVVGRSSSGMGDGPEYASAGLGPDTFVEFDLGAPVLVGGFDYFDRPADEDRVTAYDMTFSVNSTFGDAGDVVRSYTSSTMGSSDVFNGILAQYVRFDVNGNAGANTGISEMVFYQVPEPGIAALSACGLLAFGKRRRCENP